MFIYTEIILQDLCEFIFIYFFIFFANICVKFSLRTRLKRKKIILIVLRDIKTLKNISTSSHTIHHALRLAWFYFS